MNRVTHNQITVDELEQLLSEELDEAEVTFCCGINYYCNENGPCQ